MKTVVACCLPVGSIEYWEVTGKKALALHGGSSLTLIFQVFRETLGTFGPRSICSAFALDCLQRECEAVYSERFSHCIQAMLQRTVHTFTQNYLEALSVACCALQS